MILRFELREIQEMLVAHLEQRLSAPLIQPEQESALLTPEAGIVPPEETAVSEPEPEKRTEQDLHPAPAAEQLSETPVRSAVSREKTEEAVSRLCAEARGEGIIVMGLKAHLDPYFIVQIYTEELGCSDRDARAAFQAYIKKQPPAKNR